MAEIPIVRSQMKVPFGTVTLADTNVGTIVHSFVVFQQNPLCSLARGTQVEPGKTVDVVVHFTQKGKVQYLCGEPEHAEDYGEDRCSRCQLSAACPTASADRHDSQGVSDVVGYS
jgi:hypothetical protein